MNNALPKKDKIESIKIQHDVTMLDALKKMDSTFRRLLLVFDGNNFKNIVSIGDIQRAIIKNLPFTTPLKEILRKETLISNINENPENIKKRMFEQRIECMPILDNNGNLVDAIFWEDIFSESQKPIKKSFKIPVVIMAGGEGTRLRPITYILPKALIPIGRESMLEKIINSFKAYGVANFYISLNYKASMITQYIEEVYKQSIQIKYLTESKPLGTAGALFSLKNKLQGNFFVSNCDIIIENDYSEILDYHINNKNDLTIISALKHYSIPYGIIETKENGLLNKLTEKPEITYQINSGMYILNSKVLNLIPEDTYFHMTDLIEKIKMNNGKVGVFPVSEKSWKDIGDWHNYLQNNI